MTETIEPFRIDIPQAPVGRPAATPDPYAMARAETVSDWSQGVPLDLRHRAVQVLGRRVRLARDGAPAQPVPQFSTTIDGLEIHSLHVRSASRGDAAGPHSRLARLFPGVRERPRSSPTRQTGRAAAVHLVLPSLPGYGFSGRPTDRVGHPPHRPRLDRTHDAPWLPRFVAAGSDWGTSVSTSIALQQPDRLIGLHLVPPLVAPDRDAAMLTGKNGSPSRNSSAP